MNLASWLDQEPIELYNILSHFPNYVTLCLEVTMTELTEFYLANP